MVGWPGLVTVAGRQVGWLINFIGKVVSYLVSHLAAWLICSIAAFWSGSLVTSCTLVAPKLLPQTCATAPRRVRMGLSALEVDPTEEQKREESELQKELQERNFSETRRRQGQKMSHNRDMPNVYKLLPVKYCEFDLRMLVTAGVLTCLIYPYLYSASLFDALVELFDQFFVPDMKSQELEHYFTCPRIEKPWPIAW